MQLEGRRWTPFLRKDFLEMFNTLQERFALGAGRGRLFLAEPSAQAIQGAPQLGSQPINCFQGKGQLNLFRRRLGRGAGQLLQEPLPEQSRAHRVAWQNIGDKKGEGLATAAALAPIGTKYPLPAKPFPGAIRRIVPEKKTVAVQRLRATAAGAALLLERKSRSFNLGASPTK
jgi:hypothetical protein